MVLELVQLAKVLNDQPKGTELKYEGIVRRMMKLTDYDKSDKSLEANVAGVYSSVLPEYLKIIMKVQQGKPLTREDFQRTGSSILKENPPIERFERFVRNYIPRLEEKNDRIVIKESSLVYREVEEDFPNAPTLPFMGLPFMGYTRPDIFLARLSREVQRIYIEGSMSEDGHPVRLFD